MTYPGVDLGATNIRAVVADSDGTILATERRSTPRGPTGIFVTEAVLDTLRKACDDAGVDPRTVRAAGIASIGPLDLAAGAVEDPANLPNAIDRIPLTGPVSKLIDSVDVYLHNDTIAGCIGERLVRHERVRAGNLAASIPDTLSRPSANVPELAGGESERIEVVTHLRVVADAGAIGARDNLLRHT